MKRFEVHDTDDGVRLDIAGSTRAALFGAVIDGLNAIHKQAVPSIQTDAKLQEVPFAAHADDGDELLIRFASDALDASTANKFCLTAIRLTKITDTVAEGVFIGVPSDQQLPFSSIGRAAPIKKDDTGVWTAKLQLLR